MLVGQPHLIKEYNTDILRNLIAELGPVTKPVLAETTRLSLPTVNKIVDELEREGIVREGPSAQSTAAGRPAKTYLLNENAGSIAVLYYSAGEFVASLRDMIGREIDREVFLANTASLEETLGVMRAAIEYCAEQSDRLKAVGVGIPGIVKNDGCVTGIPQLPQLDGCCLGNELESVCGLPVFVENDVKLMTVGCYSADFERRCRDMVLIYAGRGLGSGIIINKRLHKGSSCFAGEYGYMATEGMRGVGEAGAALERRMTSLLNLFATEGFSGEARKEYCELAARVAVNFITVLNPQIIAFRGEYINSDALAEIKRAVGEYIPLDDMPEFVVLDSDEYGLTGAFRLCVTNISTKMRLVQQRGV